jgi:eukaryotic-like serine/threonine-protein kinase
MQTLFHRAADLPAADQLAFLIEACDGDGGLVEEVTAMLREDATGKSVLDKDLAQVANQVLNRPSRSDIGSKEFGPYLINEVLGEGGMGVVYLAERKDLGSKVAIKILRDAWLSPARRERFASEQRTLAQLNHPSIARLYDADTLNDGTPWFVMEYVEGVPLTEYCQKHNCRIERRLHLFRQVCEAVQYAHAHAVIHRDLKPTNIFVKSDGSVRLLDFGIAKQIEGLDSPVDQTRTVLRMMTPAYASPEQIRGDSIGVHTDVYSLGVILFELLTNRLPFDLSNLTPNEAASIIAGHEPGKPSAVTKRSRAPSEPVDSLNRSAWGDLDVLCLTAMHKNVDRRYRSVEALIRDVDHYLNGEPLEARPDRFSYRLGKFASRNRRPVSLVAAVFVLVMGLVVFFTVRLTKARNVAQAEAARTERVQSLMLNLFQGGDAAAGPADTLRVVTLLDRGVDDAKSLSSEPQVQAELYDNLGKIYEKLGKLEQADSLLRLALEQRKKLFGHDSAEVGESLTALGLLRADQARLEEAERFVRQGLDITTRRVGPDHPTAAKALMALGSVLAERGSYNEAIHSLNESVRIESAPGIPTSDLAASLSALADAHYSAGHYDEAVNLYNRVLEMHRQLYGNRHPLVAGDLGSLGAVKQDLGYYAEAEALYRQELDIIESYYGKNSPRTAAVLTSLGRALVYENKFDDSERALQRALAIQQQAYGEIHSSVAETLNELGNVASLRDHLDEAEAHFRKVVDIYRQIYGDHHYLVAIALSNVGSIHTDKKDYPGAERIFRDVVRRFTETLGTDNVNTAIAKTKLGRALLREKKYQEGATATLTAYNFLIKQTNPSTSFIRAALKDLAADYEALGQTDQAVRFRDELARMDQNKTRH